MIPSWVDAGWPREPSGRALRCPCCGSFDLDGEAIRTGADGDVACNPCEERGCPHHHTEVIELRGGVWLVVDGSPYTPPRAVARRRPRQQSMFEAGEVAP